MICDKNMPKRMTTNSCGYDFYMPKDLVMEPGVWYDVDTGVSFDGTECPTFDGAIFRDWFMMIAPRSSYGVKYGLKIRNTIGIIDKDYRDTIKACISVETPLTIKEGDRFMQGIFVPFGKMYREIPPTNSRNGGIGSTDNSERVTTLDDFMEERLWGYNTGTTATQDIS